MDGNIQITIYKPYNDYVQEYKATYYNKERYHPIVCNLWKISRLAVLKAVVVMSLRCLRGECNILEESYPFLLNPLLEWDLFFK